MEDITPSTTLPTKAETLKGMAPDVRENLGGVKGIAIARVSTPGDRIEATGTSQIANSAVTTAKIAANAVTLAKLASGVSPSHIVKIAGTVTWSGSGATLAASVAGVLSTDIIMVTIRVKPTQAAYLVRAVPSTDTITFELSAANTSNDAQISYTVFRAAS